MSPMAKRNLSPSQRSVRNQLKSIILESEPSSLFLTSPEVSVISEDMEVPSFTAPASPRHSHFTTLSTFSGGLRSRKCSHSRLNTIGDFSAISSERAKQMSVVERDTPKERMRRLHSSLVRERKAKRSIQ